MILYSLFPFLYLTFIEKFDENSNRISISSKKKSPIGYPHKRNSLSKGLACVVLAFSLGCVKATKFKNTQNKKGYSKTENLIPFNNRALFQAGKIRLDMKKFSHMGQSEWLGVNQFDLWFEVCDLRDRASRGTLVGQKFHIKSELGQDILWIKKGKTEGEKIQIANPIIVSSDNCLRWKQNIPHFDFFAKSANLVIHYEIESLSGNMGKIVRRVGINPWDIYRNKSKHDGVQDLTPYNKNDWPRGDWVFNEKDIVSALMGELFHHDASLQIKNFQVSLVQKEEQPNQRIKKSLKELGVDEEAEQNLRKKVDEMVMKRSGINMTIDLIAQPFIRLKDSTGTVTDTGIPTGRFKVFANLVASGASGNKKKYLLSDDVSKIVGHSTALSWKMDENGLQASIPLLLKKRNTLGRVELVMRIIPMSLGIKHLKPFTAVYDLGEWDQWVRNQRPQFKREAYIPLKNLDYEEYLKKLDIDENLRTIQDAEQYVFSSFTPRFVRIMPGDTATDRTLQYRVETCIVNGITGNPVGEGLQFNITTNDNYGGKYIIRRQTNNEGCLTWFGFLTHKYYRKEVLKRKAATVEYVGTLGCEYVNASLCRKQEEGHIKFKEEYVYYMNPWDEKWTFGWDARDMLQDYPEQIKEQRTSAPDSKIFIPEFKYETMGFRYSVDKYLNLKVKKTVLLSFHAYALKYNSIILGRGATQRLRDGVYLMKVALQKDYLDPSARGVTIYDRRLSYKKEDNNTGLNEDSLTEETVKDLNALRLNDMLKFERRSGEDNLVEMKLDNTTPQPIAVDKEGNPIKFYEDNYGNIYPAKKLYTDDNGNVYSVDSGNPLPNEMLGHGKKQFITIQQKLVRVIGGRIITPIEFEINDLRLMRIRNQFFLQLETIDERKLRKATILDKVIQNSAEKHNFQEKYQKIYELMDTLEGSFEQKLKRKDIQSKINKIFEENSTESYKEEDLQKTRDEIYAMFGLRKGMENYEKYKEEIKKKISRILQYKSAEQNTISAFRNDKRIIIDNILGQYAQFSENNIQNIIHEFEELYPEEIKHHNRDPWQKFMFPKENWKDFLYNVLKHHANNDEKLDVLKSIEEDLKNIDFTTIPLTPNFSLNLLSNAGPTPNPKYDEQGNELPDDGVSGLPARTFIGPLTFLFNRNNSHLRPTDVLNEQYCKTATCNVPEMIDQIIGTKSDNKPIYLSSDSVNEGYENNKYYGFLRAYYNMTVDKLIEMKKKIDEKHIRQMEMGSQIINFVRNMRFKYFSLNRENPDLELKEVDWENCRYKSVDSLEECYSPLESVSELHDKDLFYRQLNDRYYSRQIMDSHIESHSSETEETDEELISQSEVINPFCYNESNEKYQPCLKEKTTLSKAFNSLFEFETNPRERIYSKNLKYYYLDNHQLNDEDIREIISIGPNDKGYNPKKNRDLLHRMCFVLAQNLFSKDFFSKNVPFNTGNRYNKTNINLLSKNIDLLQDIEKDCHKFIANFYNYPGKQDGRGRKKEVTRLREENFWDRPKPDVIKYSPVVIERKIKVFKTTGRYIYRGGKSMNVNASSGFNVSSTRGLYSSTRTAFKPYSWFKDAIVGAIGVVGGAVAGTLTMGPGVGTVAGAVGGATVLTGITKSILGGFEISRATSRDETIARRGGTTVSSGVFLVAQQATLDVELGEYERCLVARFHPMFLKHILKSKLPDNFDDEKDFESLGLMICKGEKENKCLPVKEKYFYFTQHFTDGDMLDVADLHNHPWLLQLRGIRDFMTFTAIIGAREVQVDETSWVPQLANATYKDATSFNLSGSQQENKASRFKVVEQDSDFNWIIKSLSQTYFNILPSFPGIYTLNAEQKEFPWNEPDPSHLFNSPNSSLVGCYSSSGN